MGVWKEYWWLIILAALLIGAILFGVYGAYVDKQATIQNVEECTARGGVYLSGSGVTGCVFIMSREEAQ